MWGGVPGAPPPPGGMTYGGIQPGGQQQQQQQKHDIFVGNLAFTTTEEQLHQAFSEIGRVIKVRMVTDMDTGKPRGFAFIEFEDPQVALSAIRNMNDYELNGRRIRVNFSNSSHLEALAGRLGMDLSQQTQRSSGAGSGAGSASSAGAGTQAVAEALKSMNKGEMYDVIAKLKEIADRDPDEARRLLSGHPQLPEAILHLMSKLEMIKTPVSTEGYAGLNPAATPGLPPPPPPQTTTTTAAAPPRAADPRARVDPRMAAAAAAATAAPVPRKDPRAAMDPRQQQQQQAAAPPAIPPPPQQQYGVPQPAMQAPQAAVSNIDPTLVQQVMSLTPELIAQLPPDKQQSILALRQQITGGR